jgi:hypothetical protein
VHVLLDAAPEDGQLAIVADHLRAREEALVTALFADPEAPHLDHYVLR